MKKVITAMIAAAMISTMGITAFAGGGGGGAVKNDDGSEYMLSAYIMDYMNYKIGTNYTNKDNAAFWGRIDFITMADYDKYYSGYDEDEEYEDGYEEGYEEIDYDTEFEEMRKANPECMAEAYKQVNFPHREDNDSNESFISDIVAIDTWSDLPNLTTANIENDIKYISDSFNNCPQLKFVFVPKSVEKIVNSFDNSPCTIYGVQGSYAEAYAKEKGLPFVNGVEVVVNNWGIAFDQPAFIKDDRTMVPMRKIFEKLGATVDWDEATQTVTAKKGSKTISLKIGSNVLKINGKDVELDVPAFIENDRTLVPVRAISEGLGATVDWNGETQTVTIKQ